VSKPLAGSMPVLENLCCDLCDSEDRARELDVLGVWGLSNG